MVMAYGGSWNMSGVLPARAVCGEGDGTPTPAAYSGSHCISRWDSVDPTQGGASQRVMAWTQYRRQFDAHWDIEGQRSTRSTRTCSSSRTTASRAVRSSPTASSTASQIEQDDTRTESGANVRLTHRDRPRRHADADDARAADPQRRHREPAPPHRGPRPPRRRRRRASPGPSTTATSTRPRAGVFVEEEVRPARWLRFVLGARGDRVDAAVNNESQTAVDQVSGYQGAGAALAEGDGGRLAARRVGPLRQLRARLPQRTTRARLFARAAPTTLHRGGARATRSGTTVRPVDGPLALGGRRSSSTSRRSSPSTATRRRPAPSGPTRRYGVELTGRYNFDRAPLRRRVVHRRARAVHGRGGRRRGHRLPARRAHPHLQRRRGRPAAGRARDAPRLGDRALDVRPLRRLRARRRSSRPGGRSSTPERACAGGTSSSWPTCSTSADVQWREGQFEVKSRLPGERAATRPAGHQLHPGPAADADGPRGACTGEWRPS